MRVRREEKDRSHSETTLEHKKMMKIRNHYSLACLLVGVCAVFLSGCNSQTKVTWSEKVLLSNDLVVTSQRSAEGKTYSELGGPKSWDIKENSLEIANVPGGIPVPPTWRGEYMPVLLDYQAAKNTWSIVTAFNSCEAWHALGKPIPPYVEYQSASGSGWKEVPVEERLVGREANLLAGPKVTGESGVVSVSEKMLRKRAAAPVYRSVLRVWGAREDNFC